MEFLGVWQCVATYVLMTEKQKEECERKPKLTQLDNISIGINSSHSMTSRPAILDEIMFYILERAKCAEDIDKYLEHVLDYCKKDYQQAYKKKN